MAELTFEDVLKKPDFFQQDAEVQRGILNRVSPKFKKSNTEVQDSLLNRINTVGPIKTGEDLSKFKIGAEVRRGIGFEQAAEAGKRALIEQAPEEVGGAVGELVGTRFGAPVRGAAVGGGLGRVVTQGIQLATGAEEAPQTLAEAGKQIGLSATRQAAFTKAGELATRGLQKVISPFGRSVTEEGRIAIDTLEKHAPRAEGFLSKRLGLKKVQVLPAEATESRALDIMQNVVEGGVFSGANIQALKTVDRPMVFRQVFDEVAQKMGGRMSPEELASLATATINDNLNLARIPATSMYQNVARIVEPIMEKAPVTRLVETSILDESGRPLKQEVTDFVETQVGGASVSMKALKDAISKESKILRQLFPEGQAIESAASGDQIVNAVEALNNNVPYEAAQSLRTRLRTMAESTELVGKKTKAHGLAVKLERIIDNSIEQELKRVDPEALGLWREANKQWASTGTQFKNDFIKSLFKMEDFKPELIARKAFENKSKAIAFKKAIKDPELFDRFANAWVGDIYNQSFKAGTRDIGGNRLFDLTFGKSGLGESSIKEIFGAEKTSNLKRAIQTLQLTEAKQAEGIGKFAITLAQPGALFALTVGKVDALASVILGGPAVLGRLMTSPTFNKWMLNASRLPPGSKAFGANLLRIGNLARKTRNEMLQSGEEKFTTEEIQSLQGQTTLGGQ